MEEELNEIERAIGWPVRIEGCCTPVLLNCEYIVMFAIPTTEPEWFRNIWRVSKNGEVRWRVWLDGPGPYGFTGFSLKDSNIIAYDGHLNAEFQIDAETGHGKLKQFAKAGYPWWCAIFD